MVPPGSMAVVLRPEPMTNRADGTHRSLRPGANDCGTAKREEQHRPNSGLAPALEIG